MVTSPAASRPPEFAHHPTWPIVLMNCPEGGTMVGATASLFRSTWLRSPNRAVFDGPSRTSAILLTGLVLTFAHTVGEFGVVLMVGGNIPGVTRTLSVAIYDDVQALDYESAGRTALVLVAIAFAALCVTHALQRRVPSV
jgi:hypothetical protein